MRSEVHPVGDRNAPLVSALVATLWLLGALPQAIQLAIGGRATINILGATATVPLARIASDLVFWIGILVSLFIILTNLRSQNRVSLSRLAIYALPWIVASTSTYLSDGTFAVSGLIYLSIGVALWISNPPPRAFRIWGWLTILLAAGSVVGGILLPDLFLLRAGGSATDKAIIGDTLLAGFFPHPNTFGLFLVLGAPAIFLVERRSRILGIGIVALAVIWSGSRTSIAALAACLLVVMLVGLSRNRSLWRRGAAVVVIILGTIVAIALPFATHDPMAFSERGRLWMAVIARSSESILIGHGTNFFGATAQYSDNLGGLAFHAHNQYLHMLITSGVLGVIALALIVVAGTRRAVLTTSTRFRTVGLALLTVLTFSSWLEITYGFQSPGQLGGSAILALGFVMFVRSDREDESDALVVESKSLRRSHVHS